MKYKNLKSVEQWEMDLIDRIPEPDGQSDMDLDMLEQSIISRIQEKQTREHIEFHPDPTVRKHNVNARRRLKWIAVLAAAILVVSSGFAFAVSKGWDVELARAFGVSEMMEDLEDGYVKIGATDTHENNRVTVNQAIGDDTSQWIQIDTDIDWAEDTEYSVDYLPEKCELEVMSLSGLSDIDGGYSIRSYNNHGKVSYWLFPTAYQGINHAKMELALGKITRTLTDDAGKIVSEEMIDDSIYSLKWKNVYDAHVRTVKVDENVKCKLDAADGDRMVECNLTELKITPVTIYLEGAADDETIPDNYTGGLVPQVNKVRMQDGTIVEFESGDASYGYDGGSHGRFNAFITLARYDDFNEKEVSVNGNEIRSIFIGNKEIAIE